MAFNSDIYLIPPDILIVGGQSQYGIQFANQETKALQFGQVIQTYPICERIGVNQYCLFKTEGSNQLVIGGLACYLVTDKNVLLIEKKPVAP